MRILLTGGGTAGHCAPALALLPELKKRFTEIWYIGSRGGMEEGLVRAEKIPYYGVSACKLRRSLSLKNLGIPFTLFRGRRECVALLKRLKPDVVFSKGGYVALPVALACKRLKIPLVCHESDLSPGLSNRLCSRFAARVLTSFPETAKGIESAVFTGSPLKESLFRVAKERGRARYGFSGKKPVLLLFGGSSGAAALNRAVSENLGALLLRYDILHIFGAKNTPPENKAEGYVCLPFEPKMEYAYAAADLAVSRAGANALFELLTLRIPTLAVPLATGRGDQKENAAYFAEKGVLLTLSEEEIGILPSALCRLEKEAPRLRERAVGLLPQGVNRTVAELLLAVASEGKTKK